MSDLLERIRQREFSSMLFGLVPEIISEITRLRTELTEARKPDCRTCELVRSTFFGEPMCARRFEPVACINGDGYIAAVPVRLYKTDAAMAGGEK